MKKILIIVAILLALTLAAAWGYLLLNGAPENIPGFGGSNLPASGDITTPSFTEDTNTPDEVPVIVNTTQELAQLSARPVAGAVFLSRDGGEYVRYVERGTGHIYEVSLASGASARISNTTVPRTTDAVWAKTGNRVALTSEIVRGQPEILIGTLQRGDDGTESLETFSLPAGAEHVAFLDSGDAFYYAFRAQSGTVGYRYDLKLGTQTELFTIPLRDITMIWDETGDGNHYVYTDPSGELEGFVYHIENGVLTYVTKGAPGLMAERLPDENLLLSHTEGADIVSEVLDTETGVRTLTAISAFPEKCTYATTGVWCLAPLSLPAVRGTTYPDVWYQGAVLLSDFLWEVDTTTGDGALRMDLESRAGRTVDGTGLTPNDAGTHFIFVNKADSTLWLANPSS